ncbi:unnamed protein product, partial [Didymodactylos carnosus]
LRLKNDDIDRGKRLKHCVNFLQILKDALSSQEVKLLLKDKSVLFLGDSGTLLFVFILVFTIIRGVYKDLVRFLQSDFLLNEDDLKKKGEHNFQNDQLLEGGEITGLHNGTRYTEVREFTANGQHRLRFYFLTRAYSYYVKNIVLKQIKENVIKPDIVIMNMCVWDISRQSMAVYKDNFIILLRKLRHLMPDALLIWLSAMPVSNKSKGGFIPKDTEYIRPILPSLVRDANHYCKELCPKYGVMYIDTHSLFFRMLHLRKDDGIHWNTLAHRMVSEIVLNRLKAYWYGINLFKCAELRSTLEVVTDEYKQQTSFYQNRQYPSKQYSQHEHQLHNDNNVEYHELLRDKSCKSPDLQQSKRKYSQIETDNCRNKNNLKRKRYAKDDKYVCRNNPQLLQKQKRIHYDTEYTHDCDQDYIQEDYLTKLFLSPPVSEKIRLYSDNQEDFCSYPPPLMGIDLSHKLLDFNNSINNTEDNEQSDTDSLFNIILKYHQSVSGLLYPLVERKLSPLNEYQRSVLLSSSSIDSTQTLSRSVTPNVIRFDLANEQQISEENLFQLLHDDYYAYENYDIDYDGFVLNSLVTSTCQTSYGEEDCLIYNQNILYNTFDNKILNNDYTKHSNNLLIAKTNEVQNELENKNRPSTENDYQLSSRVELKQTDVDSQRLTDDSLNVTMNHSDEQDISSHSILSNMNNKIMDEPKNSSYSLVTLKYQQHNNDVNSNISPCLVSLNDPYDEEENNNKNNANQIFTSDSISVIDTFEQTYKSLTHVESPLGIIKKNKSLYNCLESIPATSLGNDDNDDRSLILQPHLEITMVETKKATVSLSQVVSLTTIEVESDIIILSSDSEDDDLQIIEISNNIVVDKEVLPHYLLDR